MGSAQAGVWLVLLLGAALTGPALGAGRGHATSASIRAAGSKQQSSSSAGASGLAARDVGDAQLHAYRELERSQLAALHQPLERLRVSEVTRELEPSIQIRVDRQELADGSGEWFTVTWTGVDNPAYDDWLAVVVPADADLTATAPSKWKFAAADPLHVIAGNGTTRFRLISYRQPVAISFMRHGFDRAVEAARSAPIQVLRPNEPLQLHLALSGTPGEMRVQWNTRDVGVAPQVRWGPAPVAYGEPAGASGQRGVAGKADRSSINTINKEKKKEDNKGGDGDGDGGGHGGDDGPAYPHSAAVDRSFAYQREDMCGGAAIGVGWVDAGTHHVATLVGLKPGTRYYYRVGDPLGDGGWSKEYSFVSAPAPGPASTIRALFVADMGQAEVDGSLEGSMMLPSLNTTTLMYRDALASIREAEAAEEQQPGSGPTRPPYALLVHNGDISYSRGFSTQWDNFMQQIEPVAARMPYMVTAGNHERDWPGTGDAFGVEDSGGECGIPFDARFPMPYPGKDKMWYALEYGPVFFLQYSTEHRFGPGSEQYQFIVKTLASVDRRRTPWLVVGGHRPIYVASTNANWPDGDQPVAQSLRDTYEDLYKQYKVDLTLQGHHHTYQRTCALYRGACQPPAADGSQTAPVHLIIGHAGAGLSLNVADPPPAWLEHLGLWWGYMRMEANGTTMRIEIVSDADGKLMDSFTLTKPANFGERFMAAAAVDAAAAQGR
ncbi:hypothetical protein HYH02_008103 [Chlamydomonas schloesseri]|uniref:Purple acid phosphatase n=1 Tax=Chlamydomonas schloesseri TaxID=2026947 RepID=A0A836B4E2_9CHLO|nr:hypothetical protein HYH02_008103 [Chlamydomonas schloesseri]|eukprot:KAG2446949.1 hypothetical protein HYH02_008103 [Chlamydomonas schloesseri]